MTRQSLGVLQAARIANDREVMHRHDASGRQLTERTHETGLRGEFAFGELVGLYPDTTRRRTGDNGVDFVLPMKLKVDVKTRRARPGGLKDTFLLVEAQKLHADIYVLAILSDDETHCECVGWIKRDDVRRFPTGNLGTGVVNHQVPATELHPMKGLVDRVWKCRE